MSVEPNSRTSLPRPYYCSVSKCVNNNNPYSNAELYQLPSDPVQRQKFSEILGISPTVAWRDSARVCALHFKSKLRNKTNLSALIKKNDTSSVVRCTVANTTNATTFATTNPATLGNAVAFSYPNFGYGGQPIKFFLQKVGPNTGNSTPNPGSSVLKPTTLTSSSISTDKIINKPAISSEDINISRDEDSNNVDEEMGDAQLNLQCEEELLSQPQLNSYYSDLVSFITANGIVRKIPACVNSATISTQTDPVTILITDQIPPQPATTSESSALDSTQDLLSEISEIDNEISAIEPSPPVIDDASLKINKSPIEKSNVLLNSPQIPHTCMTLASSSTPTITLPSLALNSYQPVSISPITFPASTMTTSFSSVDKSKLYSYLSQNPTLSTTSSMPSSITFKLKQPPPPYPSNENLQGNVPRFQVSPQNRFDSNLSSQSQPRLLPALSSAASTLVSFANQSNQFYQTSNGLALTTSSPSDISFHNQVRFAPSLSAHQMPPQLQLISLTDNSSIGTLPIYSQSSGQPLMNEDQLYSPYSSSRFNTQQFQNYTATNISDTPFQLLIQNNDQPNMLYSNNFSAQGSTLSGINTVNTSPIFPSAVESDSDKDADLLSLCNVTAVYGNDTPPQSSTPKDPTSASNTNAAGDIQQNLSFLDKLGVLNGEDSGSTLSGIESPYISGSDSSQNSMGPLIVDVISAMEGAKDYYIGDKMPNILLDKGKKDTVDKKKKDEIEKSKMYLTYIAGNKVYNVGDKIPNVLYNESKKIEIKNSKDTVGAVTTIVNKNTDFKLQTVKLNNSVFSLQTSIPIIPNGTQKNMDAQTLLGIKIPIGRSGSDDANTLSNTGRRLTAEKYITCSVWWLVRRNYMPMVGPCSCKSHAFKINRSPKHEDGYCWQCANPVCLKEEPIRRPKFFESFPSYKIESLLLLTYHWACQSPIEDILNEVDLNVEQIFAYYQALQNVCHQVSNKKCKLGLSNGSIVEAALVKLGNFFVIGAFDRKTKYTRLEAISQLDAYSTNIHIQLLENWLDKKSVLVTDQKIPDEFLIGIQKRQANSSVIVASSNDPHILNISKYLIGNLTSVFGRVDQNYLLLENVKGFLYELQWRVKYGKFLDMSFWSIMNHIRDLNDDEEIRITAKPGNLDVDSYIKTMKPPTLKKNWGTTRIFKEKTAEKVSINSPVKLNPQIQSSTKGYSKTSYQPPAPKKTQSKYVKVTNASEFFQDVPEIPGGSSNINSKSLLSIKIRCEDSTPSGIYKPNATSLGLQLRTEGFISDPVKWLVKRGYIRGVSPCYVCGDTSLLRVNSKYKDGCSWACQNVDCKFENMFRRPLFFARFNELPMAQIAAMIFHWTVQSDLSIVTSDVPLESVKISHAWRAFQVLCSAALKRDHFKVGGLGQIVEVAMVQYGKLYVLGGRQRGTKRTLLKCFPIEMKDQVDFVHETLESWILPNSYVVVNATPLFRLSKFYRLFPADTSVTDPTSTRMHVLNITSYLLKHVFEMFGHLRADIVRPHLMQVYLDELMWRERFGKLPNLAFAKIMYEIFYHEKHSSNLLEHQHTVKELLAEEQPAPIIQKEACIVLQRIPQTVLKYYNCLPIDCSTPNSTSDATKSSHNSEVSTSGEGSSLGKEPVSLLTGKSKYSDPSNENRNNSKGNAVRKSAAKVTETSSSESESTDEEWSNSTVSVDEKSSSSEDEDLEDLISNTEDNVLRNNKEKSGESSNIVPSDDSSPGITKELLIPKTEKIDDDINSPTNNIPDTNSIQPLVIKMNKNPKKSQSYLKSDFLKAKYKRQRNRRFNYRRPKRKAPKKKPNPIVSQAGISSVVVKKEVIDDEPGPSGLDQTVNSESASGAKSVKRRSALLRRLDASERQVCIECGKEVDFDHFTKEFSCTDCTKTVYTTCCGNAFFEHRSAVLFGKRMPRRNRVTHGLHRSRTLSNTALCPCGFKSKIGNQIASHLVNCLETSCFLL